MKLRVFATTILLLTGIQPVLAQQPPADPIGDSLIPPELIMQHQQEIGLNPDQRSAINAEIQKAQARFNELQWQLASEVEKMTYAVRQERIDEAQTIAQLDKILNLEREIKHVHFSLIIRIKNRLTAEQQAQLLELKRKLTAR